MEDGTLDPRHDRFEKATTSVNGSIASPWVNRVPLTVRRALPVCPDQRKSSGRLGRSGWCQSTKSLRSSPLRGGRNRETGS
jgi:hypothetical protein